MASSAMQRARRHEVSAMQTIETTVTVDEDGTGTVKLPGEITPGEHRVTMLFEERGVEPDPRTMPIEEFLEWMKIDLGPWPEGFSMRREDLY